MPLPWKIEYAVCRMEDRDEFAWFDDIGEAHDCASEMSSDSDGEVFMVVKIRRYADERDDVGAYLNGARCEV